MKMPDPCRFRHLVTLQTKTVNVADGMGGRSVTWEDTATLYVELLPLTASQQAFAAQLEHRTTHKVNSRYRSDIVPTTEQRLKYGTRYFHIHGIINIDERNLFWQFTTEEGAAS